MTNRGRVILHRLEGIRDTKMEDRERAEQYLRSTIDRRRFTMPNTGSAADGPLPLALIGLTVVAGVVDAVSYLGLGHVFVANMTGNVVFLGFLTGGATDFSVALSLVAIGSFVLGALAGGRLGRNADGHRGRLLAVSSGIQAAAVGAALLVSLAFGAGDGVSAHALVLLLAFAMGLQTASARRLGVADLTTTVLTLTLTGLAADSHHPNTGPFKSAWARHWRSPWRCSC